MRYLIIAWFLAPGYNKTPRIPAVDNGRLAGQIWGRRDTALRGAVLIRIDRVILIAFGIAFVLGAFLAGIGAWQLWRKIKKWRYEKPRDG